MHGEDCRHERAFPQGAGGLLEQPEKYDDVEAMQEEAGEMVSSWIHAEETELHHVEEPGQWMPVPHDAVSESPLDVAPGDGLDVGIACDVVGIIQQQEFVARDGTEAQEGERQQKRRYKEILIPD